MARRVYLCPNTRRVALLPGGRRLAIGTAGADPGCLCESPVACCLSGGGCEMLLVTGEIQKHARSRKLFLR